MGRGCGNCGSGAKDAHSPKPASRPNADQGAQPQSEAVQPHTSNINQRKSSTSQVAPRNAGNTTAVAPQTRIAIDPAAPGPAATQSSASKTATVQPAPSPNKIAVSSTGVSPAGKPETSINSIHVQSTPVAVPTGATHSPKAAAPPTTAAAGSANSNSTQLNELAALLKNVPLLSKLNDAERATLGSALVEKTFAAGSRLVVEGEEGKEFFIIKSGEARVTKKQADGSELELCLLKTYDYMGETALQSSANRRMATITATKETVCFTMERSKFSALFGKDKLNVTFAKRQAVSAETYTPDAQSNVKHTEVSAADRHKSTKQRDMILAVVKTSILFNALNPEQQASVVDTMWLKKCTQQETVIRQGDLGDYWYIVESGQFDIFLAKKDVNAGAPQKVASRAAGSSFGELALLYNAPRAATVTAVSADAAVWVLDRWTFRKILTTSSDLRLKEYEQFLRGVQSFQVLLDYERAKIAEALEEVSFTSGAKIVTQGDTGSTFFILKQGTVIVTVQPQSSSSDQLKAAEVARYEPGAFFGERALVRNEVRAATCTASGPVTCLYLNRDNFNMLLGPMEDIFKERVEGYNAALSPGRQVEADKVKHESDAAKAKTKSREDKTESYLDASIKLADLKVLGTLGKGSFGHVQLVKSTVTGSTYALKTVSKAQVVNLGQQEHIMSEKKAMASLNHPFLIRLHATFKDRDCLYFLLEPSLGGELFSVLRAKTFFDEATARFFAAGVVLAFEYMSIDHQSIARDC